MLKTPIYIQIRDALADRIQSGELPPGSRIPSERALSQEYGVSRMTVRQAITDLVNRGLLVPYPGNGTYVTEPKVSQIVSALMSFTESMERKGIVPGARLLEAGTISANRALARHLGIGVGERVYRIVRLRTGNEQPMALEHSFFPVRLCPGLDRSDLESRSIYRILREEHGLELTKAVQAMEPTVANEFESQMLQVPLGAPLMLLERVASTADGVAVEYAKDLYRGDRSRFVVEMTVKEDSHVIGARHDAV